jgi:hypothetical protein
MQGAEVLKRTKTLVAACTGATAIALLGVAVPASATVTSTPAHGDDWGNKDHNREEPLPRGVVLARTGLLVRAEATTRAPVVDGLKWSQIIDIQCKKFGENVLGNSIWYRLDDDWSWNKSGRWVSARWVRNVDFVPFC